MSDAGHTLEKSTGKDFKLDDCTTRTPRHLGKLLRCQPNVGTPKKRKTHVPKGSSVCAMKLPSATLSRQPRSTVEASAATGRAGTIFSPPAKRLWPLGAFVRFHGPASSAIFISVPQDRENTHWENLNAPRAHDIRGENSFLREPELAAQKNSGADLTRNFPATEAPVALDQSSVRHASAPHVSYRLAAFRLACRSAITGSCYIMTGRVTFGWNVSLWSPRRGATF